MFPFVFVAFLLLLLTDVSNNGYFLSESLIQGSTFVHILAWSGKCQTKKARNLIAWKSNGSVSLLFVQTVQYVLISHGSHSSGHTSKPWLKSCFHDNRKDFLSFTCFCVCTCCHFLPNDWSALCMSEKLTRLRPKLLLSSAEFACPLWNFTHSGQTGNPYCWTLRYNYPLPSFSLFTMCALAAVNIT